MVAKSMKLPSSGALDANQKHRCGMAAGGRRGRHALAARALDACSKFPLGLIHVQMGKQLPSRLELSS
jgi:hypothetical protein